MKVDTMLRFLLPLGLLLVLSVNNGSNGVPVKGVTRIGETSCPARKWRRIDSFCVLESKKEMGWQDARDYCRSQNNSYLTGLLADDLDDLNSVVISEGSFRLDTWTSLNNLNGFLEWKYFVPYPYNEKDLMIEFGFQGFIENNSCVFASSITKFALEESVEYLADYESEELPPPREYDIYCRNGEMFEMIFQKLLAGEITEEMLDGHPSEEEIVRCFQRTFIKEERRRRRTEVNLLGSSCDRPRAFNCYLRPHTESLKNENTGCPSDWFGNEDSKFCYNLIDSIGDGGGSAKACALIGGEIVAPENQTQLQLVTTYLKSVSSKEDIGVYLDFSIDSNGSYSNIFYNDGRHFNLEILRMFPKMLRSETNEDCVGLENESLNLTLWSLACRTNSWLVCQRPKLPFATKRKTEIQEVMIDMRMIDDVLLECEDGWAQNYVWYKDRRIWKQFNEGRGSLRLRQPLSHLHGPEQLQGHYECLAFDPEYNLVSTKRFNVVFKDVRKYILRVEYGISEPIAGIARWGKYIADVSSIQLQELFPNVFVPAGISVVNKRIINVEEMPKRIYNEEEPLGYIITVEMNLLLNSNLDFSRYYSKIGGDSKKEIYPKPKVYMRDEDDHNKRTNQPTLNSFENNKKNTRNYLKEPRNSIKDQLKAYAPILHAIVEKTILSPRVFYTPAKWKPDSVSLLSADGCLDKAVLHADWKLRFGYALAGERRTCVNKCPNTDRKPIAKATCKGNRDEGYVWVLDSVECKPQEEDYNDELTKNLTSLLDISMSREGGHERVMFDLERITSDFKDELTAINLDIISEIFEKSAQQASRISKNEGRDLISTVDNLMQLPTDRIHQAQLKFNTSFKLQNAFEELISRVTLDGTDNMTLVKENIAVCVVKVDPTDNSTIAFGVATERARSPNATRPSGSIEGGYLYGKKVLGNKHLAASIEIPWAAVSQDEKSSKDQQVNFVVYKNTKLFSETTGDFGTGERQTNTLRSMVVSSSVNGKAVADLKEKIKLTFKVKKTYKGLVNCMWSDPRSQLIAVRHLWSTKGLETREDEEDVEEEVEEEVEVLCFSDHLTNFAVFAGYQGDPNTGTSKALRAISIIGSSLSIFCLFLLIIFYIFVSKRKQRKGQDQVALINLAISLILLNSVLLAGVDRTDQRIPCMLVAALLHYLLLVSFAWMLVESVLQYYKFVKVFNTHVSKFRLKTAIPAWGVPAVIVLTTAGVDFNQFRGPEHYCWLAALAFRFAFLLPLSVILFINFVIFFLIFKAITCDRPVGMQTNQSPSRLKWLQLQVAVCCFVVMGLTWTFALFAVGKGAVVMQFLFAIFNSLQGFFIFVLFNLRDRTARRAWLSIPQRLCACCFKAEERKDGPRFYYSSGLARIFNKSEDDSSREMATTSDTKSSRFS